MNLGLNLPKKIFKLPGTKASIQNSLLLTSSGVPSLDSIIGGGIPVGSIVLVEEDCLSKYSDTLLKCFLAEGVMVGHRLFVASLDDDPSEILKTLPAPIIDSAIGQESYRSDSGSEVDDLKIAWKYKSLSVNPVIPTISGIGHHFDLSQKMAKESVECVKPHVFTFNEVDCNRSLYNVLLQSISAYVDSCNVSTLEPAAPTPTVLRMALHSLHSPLWECGKDAVVCLCYFLHRLRAIVRHSLTTCLITAPLHLMQDPVAMKRIERMCDIVVRLESFEGSEKHKNPVFKDYQGDHLQSLSKTKFLWFLIGGFSLGLFHVIKVVHPNVSVCPRPEAADFGFKVRRKKFVVEVLNLPPDLSEAASRELGDRPCGRSGRSIEF